MYFILISYSKSNLHFFPLVTFLTWHYCQFKILPQERPVILRYLLCIDTEKLPSAQLPLVSLSFSLFWFAALVWLCVKSRLCLSWKPQFDLGGHLEDVKSMTGEKRKVYRKQASSSRIRKIKSETQQPSFQLARPQMNTIGSRSSLLEWLIHENGTFTFTRRGHSSWIVPALDPQPSTQIGGHALLTPFMLHLCACLSTHVRLLCMFMSRGVRIIWVTLITI